MVCFRLMMNQSIISDDSGKTICRTVHLHYSPTIFTLVCFSGLESQRGSVDVASGGVACGPTLSQPASPTTVEINPFILFLLSRCWFTTLVFFCCFWTLFVLFRIARQVACSDEGDFVRIDRGTRRHRSASDRVELWRRAGSLERSLCEKAHAWRIRFIGQDLVNRSSRWYVMSSVVVMNRRREEGKEEHFE